MSNKAKVTVVIPNYNGLKFMDPCFKALDLQLCRDFDILVVDNGSTDGSVEWLKEHEIPSIFLEKNTGFSGAVNVGIKASKTPYVILVYTVRLGIPTGRWTSGYRIQPQLPCFFCLCRCCHLSQGSV